MLDRLLRTDTAVATYSSVVKRWECDRNNHWNVQFYVRAFQMASEILASATTGENPGSQSTAFRHYRFHGELFCPETMRVLSARIAEGPYAGWVLHRMLKGKDDRLSATAIEKPAYPVADLPVCTAAELQPALPRGLPAAPHELVAAPRDPQGAALPTAMVGVVRPSDVDHRDRLQWNALAGLCSGASHSFLNQLGLTADWINESNCNRMAVEMSVTLHGGCGVGDSLDIQSWVSDLGSRHFTTRHQILNTQTGAPCATLEQLLLVIDLEKRKPVSVPDFLREAARAHGLGGLE
ncbi:acyl-CoA thioesterase [Salipiger abyssi]|uniref:acyl-CoA thioesterase n=1 Tax=Salipiger abyssi TaxID=1250539 RepID=UPI0040593323